MDRRNFIKISSVLTAGSTVLTGCGKSLREAAPVLVPENQLVLGEENWVKSVCGGCGAGCGTMVRVVDGRAVKMEGLPGHPVNDGRLCARGQAEPQALYNPDRIRAPRRGGQEISWEQAIETAAEKLRAPARVVLITRPFTGLRGKLIAEFAQALGARHVVLEPLDESAVLEANRLTCGYAARGVPDFGNSNYVLSFGAPLVESGSPVRAQRLLAHMRQGRPGRRGKLVQAETRYSLTAVYADEWLALKPGSEGTLALAVAHVLLRDGLFDKEFAARRAQGLDRFRQVVSAHTPEAAAAATGIEAKRTERIAREFAEHKPAIAVAGGAAAGHAHSLPALVAVNALNALVGNLGTAGGIWFDAAGPLGARASRPPQRASNESADAGKMPALPGDVVIAYGANPVFERPGLPWGKVPFLISLSPFPDETATAAHLVLPDHTALERWESRAGEGGARGAVLSAGRPAVEPLYQTRDGADTLLAIAAKAGKPLPYESWEKAIAAEFGDELSDVLARGGSWTEEKTGTFAFATPSRKYEFVPTGMEFSEERAGSPRSQDELLLHVYTGVSLGTGEAANLSWLQELPDPLSQAVWTTAAELNPATARRLGIGERERIWIESPRGKMRARAVLSPAAPPDSVVVAAGQGHTAYGRYARDRGGNVYALLDPSAWADTQVKVTKG